MLVKWVAEIGPDRSMIPPRSSRFAVGSGWCIDPMICPATRIGRALSFSADRFAGAGLGRVPLLSCTPVIPALSQGDGPHRILPRCDRRNLKHNMEPALVLSDLRGPAVSTFGLGVTLKVKHEHMTALNRSALVCL